MKHTAPISNAASEESDDPTQLGNGEPAAKGDNEESEAVGIECGPPILAAKQLRLVLGAVLGGLIGTEIYSATIGTLPIPIPWIIAPAAIGAVVAFFLPSPRWVRATLIEDGRFTFQDSKRQETSVTPEEVLFVSGMKGLNFDGGDILAPQCVQLITTAGTFTLKVGPEVATEAYEIICEQCAHAAHMPFDGELHVPESLDATERSSWLADVRELVAGSLGGMIRQAWTGAIVALVLAVAAGGGSIAAIAAAGASANGGPVKLIIASIIILVCAVMLAVHAFKLGARRTSLLASLE